MKRDLVDFLLSELRERPGMYLGINDISRLPSFVAGFMIASAFYDQEKSGLNRFSDFHEWFEKKHGYSRPSSWTTPFLEVAHHDGKAALDLLFKELDLFISGKTDQGPSL